MKVLSLNCGSSSVKYQLYNWEEKEIIAKGIVERVTIGDSFCIHEVSGRDQIVIKRECRDQGEAVQFILDTLSDRRHGVVGKISEIDAVGHRVVHGGEEYAKSVVINNQVLKTFKDLIELAPQNNPANILGIEAARSMMPGVPHIAVLDTAWHQTMEPAQFLYAVPYTWYEKYKVRRYGFHGTSLLYVAKRAAVLLGKNPFDCNLILLHVGNGVSANAVRNGRSYDTSMGFTPLDGLIMGTRAGDHDAALDFYIMRKEGMDAREMDRTLNKKSGLLGITGQYTDRRDIIRAMKKGDERSLLAYNMEAYRLRKYIGAYAAALGRVDALVWTAGVGEMSSDLRAKTMEGLESIGIKYDAAKNIVAQTRNAECDISAPGSSVKLFVIPTDEEIVCIEDTVALLEGCYDVHTNFTYSFQSPNYRNKMRDRGFEEELRKKPGKRLALASIPRGSHDNEDIPAANPFFLPSGHHEGETGLW